MQKKSSFQNQLLAIISMAVLAVSSNAALASGGGSYGGGGGFGGGGFSQQQRVVDQNYEQGKAIFNGRLAGTGKISYCIQDPSADNALVPVKRKSLKPYKRVSYQEFSQSLYNCDEPNTLIAKQLKRDDYLYVLYYLNKRYKLALK